MNDTLQIIIVTLVALAALLVLARTYLPGRRDSSKPGAPGCSNCASNPAAPAHRRGPGA